MTAGTVGDIDTEGSIHVEGMSAAVRDTGDGSQPARGELQREWVISGGEAGKPDDGEPSTARMTPDELSLAEATPQSCHRCGFHNRGDGLKMFTCTACGSVNHPGERSKATDIPVTSSQTVVLTGAQRRALRREGKIMAAAGAVHILLVLVMWHGFDPGLMETMSPWLLIYLPPPLAALSAAWSLDSARQGHVVQQESGLWAKCSGCCGTSKGCNGPSCVLNLAVDLGLLLTGALSFAPAVAAADGKCGYACIFFCFPCPPVDAAGAYACLAVTSLVLSAAALAKLWTSLDIVKNVRVDSRFVAAWQ